MSGASVGGECAVGHGNHIACHAVGVGAIEHAGESGAAIDGNQGIAIHIAVGVAALERVSAIRLTAIHAILTLAQSGHCSANFV